jgi:hypothetical protein
MEISCRTFFSMGKMVMLLVWTTWTLESLKTLILLRKCKLAAVQREPRGQIIFIGRKTKLYARAGWMLAKILLTEPINLVPRFGEEFMLTLRNTRKLMLWGQRVPLCIGGWQFSSKWTSFCSCYEAIQRRNQSGSTIEDNVCNMCCFAWTLFIWK